MQAETATPYRCAAGRKVAMSVNYYQRRYAVQFMKSITLETYKRWANNGIHIDPETVRIEKQRGVLTGQTMYVVVGVTI